MNKPEKIDPASGKLGILIPGMGAVATTFIAGVEAIKAGLGEPIGSLTQMGTIRLGKRTENRSPLIKNFVSLASLEDLVFGGWDVFPDNAYQAATHAEVIEKDTLEKLKDCLTEIVPMKAISFFKRRSLVSILSSRLFNLFSFCLVLSSFANSFSYSNLVTSSS